MVGPFATDIEAWHDFYMLAGSAAATLLGLLFVAVSLHIDMISKASESGEVRMFSRRTFANFLIILSFAFIFLIPNQNPTGTGIPLLIIGLLELGETAILWKRYERGGKGEQFMDAWQFRSKLLIPNTVCYMALIFISVNLLMENTDYLGWMVLVIIWLLIVASQSAWILMLRLAEMRQDLKADG